MATGDSPKTLDAADWKRLAAIASRAARGILRDQSDVEDVTQQTLSVLWARLSLGDRIDNPSAFAVVVARNLALSLIRKERREERTESALLSEAPTQSRNSPIDHVDDVVARLVIDSLVQRLSPLQREVVRGLYVDGLDTAGIADKLGVSVNTVRTHRSRALQNLRSLVRADEVADG